MDDKGLEEMGVQDIQVNPAIETTQGKFPWEPLLTIEDVSHYLRLNSETVRAMARDGKLPSLKVGRNWRFRRAEIEAWVQTNGSRK
jgi:excisionase family DNA binding protein